MRSTITNTERHNFASRTGSHATVFDVRSNPTLKNPNVLHDEEVLKFPFVGGSSYKGEWNNNLKEGFGVLQGTDGTKYEGEWKAGKRHGRGTLWVKKGKKYVKRYAGEWAGDRLEGSGYFYYDNGDIYRGLWLRDKRSGHGIMECENGDVFEGEWFNDKKQGPGVLFLENGNIYDGHWLNDMKEGPGRFLYASTRKVYEGEWVGDAPRCGEFRDPTPDEENRFGETAIRKGKFNLPNLGLADSRSVLDSATMETRIQRAVDAGMSRGYIEKSAVDRAEPLFNKLSHPVSHTAPLCGLGHVFEALGVELSEETLDGIAEQFEINISTELSFPEVVDIVSFILGEDEI